MRILESRLGEEHRYRVAVGPGALSRGEWSGYTRALVVHDEAAPAWGVEELVQSLRLQGVEASTYRVRGGEQLKTLEGLLGILDSMKGAGLDRWSVLVAYGGGSVSDAAGLAAALYMRGVDWAVAPTTMLGMVDASVGGKTGINYGGKNLVGAFHHPTQVLVDTRLAGSLPRSEYLRGYSEVVKHGVISGWGMLGRLEELVPGILGRVEDAVAEAVSMSLEVKLGVVSRDPRERRGIREVLNLGHTVAHAIEKASGYRVPHGDAVAMGLVAELRAGEAIAGADPRVGRVVASLLSRLGLPTEPPRGLARGILEAVRLDKKRRGDSIRLPIAYTAGDVRVVDVPIERLVEVLGSVLE